MKEAAFSLLRDLTEAHGAPGHEDGPRAIFAREMAPLGTLTTDRLGSVLCEVGGPATAKSGPRLMITAHLDEVGFMVHSITEAGFLTALIPEAYGGAGLGGAASWPNAGATNCWTPPGHSARPSSTGSSRCNSRWRAPRP